MDIEPTVSWLAVSRAVLLFTGNATWKAKGWHEEYLSEASEIENGCILRRVPRLNHIQGKGEIIADEWEARRKAKKEGETLMHHFMSSSGLSFNFNPDLSGNVYINRDGAVGSALVIRGDDLVEFIKYALEYSKPEVAGPNFATEVDIADRYSYAMLQAAAVIYAIREKDGCTKSGAIGEARVLLQEIRWQNSNRSAGKNP